MPSDNTVVRSGDLVTYAAPWSNIAPPATVKTAWGLIAFDPLDMGSIAYLDIDSSALDHSEVDALLAAAASARDLSTESSEQQEADPVWSPLARLAQVDWLQRWSPYDTHRDPILLDRGAALAATGFTYKAFLAFDGSVGYLSRLLQWSADRLLPAPVQTELREVASEALRTLGERHPAIPRIESGLEAGEGSTTVPDTLPDMDELDRLFPPARRVAVQLGGPHRAVASHHMVGGSIIAGLSSSLSLTAWRDEWFDWWVTPPTLSTEGSADFRWRYDSHQEVVEVELSDSPRQPSERPTLIARLGHPRDGQVTAEAPFDRGSTRPTARIPLTLRDWREFTTAPWDGPLIEVAVLSHRAPIPVERERLQRVAERDAIRALCLARAGNAMHAFDPDSAEEITSRAIDHALAARQQWPAFDTHQRRGSPEGAAIAELDALLRRQRRRSIDQGPSRPTLAEYLTAATIAGLDPP